ncbi:PhnD/SsuA/transferrin family substrate-binding protein [Rhodobacteraceae bacterium KMM 6894]|nr:PhnD/SsuA/transferrin family substrate-binding protein [Rhodobacteraceae bacterium KMM 6894]
MIANLMMYQRPQLVEAHDRFWRLIRKHLSDAGVDSPETLSQDAEEFYVWNHPDLVLSQTCGMPYRTWLHYKVQLVGTPDYGLPDCPPGYYRSAIIVRTDDDRTELPAFKDAVFAYNQTFSQSGYAAPYWHLKPEGFWFENRLQTEQHLESARAIATGRADIASIDAVTWRNIETYEPFASDLRVLEWTKPTPGLPLITALGNDAELIFEAVKSAIGELDEQSKSQLGIKGVVKIPKEDYLKARNPE